MGRQLLGGTDFGRVGSRMAFSEASRSVPTVNARTAPRPLACDRRQTTQQLPPTNAASAFPALALVFVPMGPAGIGFQGPDGAEAVRVGLTERGKRRSVHPRQQHPQY